MASSHNKKNMKNDSTKYITCECGRTVTQAYYKQHLQNDIHFRHLNPQTAGHFVSIKPVQTAKEFAKIPLCEFPDLMTALRYKSKRLRSYENVCDILKRCGINDIYKQKPVIFDEHGHLLGVYHIEHIHEVQVLVYAINRTPQLLGGAFNPLRDIINDTQNLGISDYSVNISKGRAITDFLDCLDKLKPISLYGALTRHKSGKVRSIAPYANNIIRWINDTHQSFSDSIREARRYDGYVTGHNAYGLLADQFDLIIQVMQLDLDHNIVLYNSPNDHFRVRQSNSTLYPVDMKPALHPTTILSHVLLRIPIQMKSSSTTESIIHQPDPLVMNPRPVIQPTLNSSNSTRVNPQLATQSTTHLPNKRLISLRHVAQPVVQPPNLRLINPQPIIQSTVQSSNRKLKNPRPVVQPTMNSSNSIKVNPQPIVHPPDPLLMNPRPVVQPTLNSFNSTRVNPQLATQSTTHLPNKRLISLRHVAQPIVQPPDPRLVNRQPVVQPTIQPPKPRLVNPQAIVQPTIQPLNPRLLNSQPVVQRIAQPPKPRLVNPQPVVQPTIQPSNPRLVNHRPVSQPTVQPPNPRLVNPQPVVQPTIQPPNPRLMKHQPVIQTNIHPFNPAPANLHTLAQSDIRPHNLVRVESTTTVRPNIRLRNSGLEDPPDIGLPTILLPNL